MSEEKEVKEEQQQEEAVEETKQPKGGKNAREAQKKKKGKKGQSKGGSLKKQVEELLKEKQEDQSLGPNEAPYIEKHLRGLEDGSKDSKKVLEDWLEKNEER